MVSSIEQLIINESIRRLQQRLEGEFESGRMEVEIHGDIPERVKRFIKHEAARMATLLIIMTQAKLN